MPRQRSKKISERRKTGKASTLELQSKNRKTAQDNSPEPEWEEERSGSEEESEDFREKDEEEEELDRLVLGDAGGFRAQLGEGMDLDFEEGSDGEGMAKGEEEDGGLEGVDDADLFFLDSGPSAIDSNALIPRATSEDGEGEDAPAWEDSDDDRLDVSLAGNPRLRKLRVNADEDIVSGREYTKRLRRQFERLNPVPEWAQARPAKRRRRSSAGSGSSISSDGEMDVDQPDLKALPLAKFLQNAGSLTRTATGTKRAKLRPEVIDIQRTRDIPGVQPSAITSLNFHSKYPLLLSSGPASTLYLHHIAPDAHPTPNPLLTSVHIRKTPLHTSAFLPPSGDTIFFSGRRKYFHTWDLESGTIQKVTRIYGQQEEQKSMERFKPSPCGRYMALVGSSRKGGGIVNVIDANTTQWIASARIEGRNGVADFAWWGDGEGLTIVGKGGEVGEWSVDRKSFVARWVDEGHAPTVVTLGGDHGPAQLGGDRWVVIGSQSGMVNIYDRRTFVNQQNELQIPERPTPKRSFAQLKRATSNLAISPDGQLLVLSTKWEKDGLRLVHLPSCTVYRNWPTSSTPLGRVTAVAFGKREGQGEGNGEVGVLAVGNEAGKCRLFEIRA